MRAVLQKIFLHRVNVDSDRNVLEFRNAVQLLNGRLYKQFGFGGRSC